IDTGLTNLNTAFSSVQVPHGALDKFRSKRLSTTSLNGAISSTTASSAVLWSGAVTRAGAPQMLKIDSEEVFAVPNGTVGALGTTTIDLMRGVNNTTAATHTDLSSVIPWNVTNVVTLGDSTTENTNMSGAAGWVEMLRRSLESRFGGSLGSGLTPVYRAFNNTGARTDGYAIWRVTGSWALPAVTATYWQGWTSRGSAGSSSDILTFTPEQGDIIQQADILWVEYDNFNNNWSYRYSTDHQNTWSTWTDNPNPPSYPTATTTLSSADNGRTLSYWDGTKTMTIGSTTGFPTAGQFQLITSSGTAMFSYSGVASATVLSNVKLQSSCGSTWTSATSQVVKIYPVMKKSTITGFTANPTDIQIRAANAAGVSKSTSIYGIYCWSSIPNYNTRGVVVNNLGYDGQTLQFFLQSRTIDDLVTTSGSSTVTSAQGAFGSSAAGAIGRKIISANLPANTVITAYTSSTSVTVSNNATASGTGLATLIGTGSGGDYGRILNGSPASLLPDLTIIMFTNDMFQNDRSVTDGVTSTGGTGKTVTSATANFTSLDVGKHITGTGIPNGAVIATINSSTSVEINLTITSSNSGVTLGIQQTQAMVVEAIKQNMTEIYNRISPHSSVLFIAPFEQGGDRSAGNGSAIQAAYRAQMKATAATLGAAFLDFYASLSAEGIVGYSGANSAGYMLDTLHETASASRDFAAKISRMLEVF
ncbi:MAG: hypothetical protein ACXWLH_06110, partial [Candidatus Saccharimonadales bacterium]